MLRWWTDALTQVGEKWHKKNHHHREQPSRATGALTPRWSSARPLKTVKTHSHPAKVAESTIKQVTLVLKGSSYFRNQWRRVTLNSGGLTSVEEVTWTLIKRIFKGSAASLENAGKPARGWFLSFHKVLLQSYWGSLQRVDIPLHPVLQGGRRCTL